MTEENSNANIVTMTSNEIDALKTIHVRQLGARGLQVFQDTKGNVYYTNSELKDGEYAKFHISEGLSPDAIWLVRSITEFVCNHMAAQHKEYSKEYKLLIDQIPKEGEPLLKEHYRLVRFTRIAILDNFSSRLAIVYKGEKPLVYATSRFELELYVAVPVIEEAEPKYIIHSEANACTVLPYALTLEQLSKSAHEVCNIDTLVIDNIKVEDLLKQMIR